MRIWLDDERPIPTNYDIHVKTVAEAIKLIQTGKVEAISLDNDLGMGITEGKYVAKFIEEMAFLGEIGRISCRVHTANPAARREMCAALQNADRYWSEYEELKGQGKPN